MISVAKLLRLVCVPSVRENQARYISGAHTPLPPRSFASLRVGHGFASSVIPLEGAGTGGSSWCFRARGIGNVGSSAPSYESAIEMIASRRRTSF